MTIIDLLNKIRDEIPSLFKELRDNEKFLELVRTDLIHNGECKSELNLMDITKRHFRIRNFRFDEHCYFMVEVDGKVKEILEV